MQELGDANRRLVWVSASRGSQTFIWEVTPERLVKEFRPPGGHSAVHTGREVRMANRFADDARFGARDWFAQGFKYMICQGEMLLWV